MGMFPYSKIDKREHNIRKFIPALHSTIYSNGLKPYQNKVFETAVYCVYTEKENAKNHKQRDGRTSKKWELQKK